MPGNRKAAEELILDVIRDIDDNGPNRGIWESRLQAMSDEEFDGFITRLEAEEQYLHIFVPNQAVHNVDVTRNIGIARDLGHEFFERLYLTDPKTGQVLLTPKKYMVLHLPVRRQEQTLEKKISIPDNNRVIDDLTGQPTGASKGSSLSFPELQVLYSKDMTRSIEEIFKVRGGDERAFREHNRLIAQTGNGPLDTLQETPTKVKSTESFSTILTGMHLGNTL